MTEDDPEVRKIMGIVSGHLQAMMRDIRELRPDLQPTVANGAVAMFLTTYMARHPDRAADVQEQVNLLLARFCPIWRMVRVD